MTHPNPAGYYGLQMPEQLETEITELDCEELTQTLSDLVGHLNRDDDAFEFEGVYVSSEFDGFMHEMKQTDVIALIRWVAERLSWIETQEKANETYSQDPHAKP
jgi:hypothetical protein